MSRPRHLRPGPAAAFHFHVVDVDAGELRVGDTYWDSRNGGWVTIRSLGEMDAARLAYDGFEVTIIDPSGLRGDA
jgi:hypothetical protein